MERRKYTRISTITGVIIHLIKENTSYKGVVINIGAGGIGVIITMPLEIGEDVELTFKLSAKLNFENIKGFIARTEYLGDKFFTFIGINFLNLEFEQRAQFNKFVLDKKLQEYGFKIRDERV